MSGSAESHAPLDKQTLRRRLRTQRRSVAPQQDRDADARAIASAASPLLDTRLLSPSRTGGHPAYGEGSCVAIYLSLPTEPPTHALKELLHASGLRVIVPELLPDKDLDWHELRADDTQGPRLGPHAIGAAKVIFTPALAVDHSGTRLGQGGGSYDRALTRRDPDAVIVAIVNDREYAAWPLACDAHDVRVDAVITPAGGLTSIPRTG